MLKILGTQTPDDLKDYSINFAGQLSPTDSLDEPSVTWDAGDLTVAQENVAGAAATVWLTGGVDNRQYKVTCTAGTTEGRTIKAAFLVDVRDV